MSSWRSGNRRLTLGLDTSGSNRVCSESSHENFAPGENPRGGSDCQATTQPLIACKRTSDAAAVGPLFSQLGRCARSVATSEAGLWSARPEEADVRAIEHGITGTLAYRRCSAAWRTGPQEDHGPRARTWRRSVRVSH